MPLGRARPVRLRWKPYVTSRPLTMHLRSYGCIGRGWKGGHDPVSFGHCAKSTRDGKEPLSPNRKIWSTTRKDSTMKASNLKANKTYKLTPPTPIILRLPPPSHQHPLIHIFRGEDGRSKRCGGTEKGGRAKDRSCNHVGARSAEKDEW